MTDPRTLLEQYADERCWTDGPPRETYAPATFAALNAIHDACDAGDPVPVATIHRITRHHLGGTP